jgi:hypothetical protein
VAKEVGYLSKLMPVFVDGSNSSYICPRIGFQCEFTVDGTLIGYSDNAIYDLSPSTNKKMR